MARMNFSAWLAAEDFVAGDRDRGPPVGTQRRPPLRGRYPFPEPFDLFLTKSAIDSTWAVWGNMSITPARASR